MRSLRLKIYFLTGCLILAAAFFVFAQEDPFAKLTYPIPELGNCQSRTACGTYCDKPENMKSCLDFAGDHDLLSEEEIEMGQKMLALGETRGPGGCKGQEECETYCDQIEHIKECITFAEKNNLIPPDELQEAKKVVQAIDRGLVPPKCKGKKECDVYCSKPANMEECITFGEAAGLIPPGELREAKMMFEAIRKGAKPPACAGKKECDVYCSRIEHMEECMEFGIAAGFIPPEEIEGARAALKAIKQGIRPPNCRGKEECDAYCSQPEHQKECINFAEAAGFMTAEEAARARKMAELGIEGGPGGCQGKEECEAFCQNPANLETCINFSVKTGDMSQEEAQRMLEGIRMMQEGPPPETTPPQPIESSFQRLLRQFLAGIVLPFFVF